MKNNTNQILLPIFIFALKIKPGKIFNALSAHGKALKFSISVCGQKGYGYYMSSKPEYVYLLYPIPVEKLKDLPIPFMPAKKEFPVPVNEEEFVPLWYGNAKFPEDDI